MAQSFDNLKAEYQSLYNSLQIRPDKKLKLEWYISKLISYREIYERVGLKLSMPWYIIGILHGRESSFNMTKNLHNGEPWNQRTKLVPAGRGPFDSFEESCIDAMIYDGLAFIKDWSLPHALYQCEKFNGFGYRNKHPDVLSPYLWAGSYHYQAGCYATDGRFDRNFIDDTIGVATLIKELEARGLIKLGQSQLDKVELPAPTPVKELPQAPYKPSLLSRFKGFLSRLFK